MTAALTAFTALAGKVVVLGHTPTVPSFAACLSGSADISRCIGEVMGTYRSETLRERRLVEAAGAVFVDTSSWLCVVAGGRRLCPAVVDGAPVWRDGTHLTSDLERKLIPLVRALLRSPSVAAVVAADR